MQCLHSYAWKVLQVDSKKIIIIKTKQSSFDKDYKIKELKLELVTGKT